MSWFTYYNSPDSVEPLRPSVRRYIKRFTPKVTINVGHWMSIDVSSLNIDKILNSDLQLVNNDYSYKVVYHNEDVDGGYNLVDSIISNGRLYFKAAEEHLADEPTANRYHIYYMDNNLKNVIYDEISDRYIISNPTPPSGYTIGKYEILNTYTGYYGFSFLNPDLDWSNGYANRVGSTSTLLFTGPNLELYGTTGPDYGSVEITIYPIINQYFTDVEDAIVEVVDLYSFSELRNSLIYSVDSLSYRDYIAEIKSVATQNIKSTSSKVYLSKAEFDLNIYMELSKEELYSESSFNFLKVSNSRIFTLQNLKPGKKYIITARAKNSDMNVNSDFLNTKMFTVPEDLTIPAVPGNLSIDASFLSIMFDFDPVSDIDLYTYEYEIYEENQVELSGGSYILKYEQEVEDDWAHVGLNIDGEELDDYFGWSVDLSSDGNRLAVGAIYNGGNGVTSGHVRVFDWDGTSWIQVGSDIDGESLGDNFGSSVSLSSDGSRLAIGAAYNDGNGTNSGHVRVYDWDESNWVQVGYDIDGEAPGDWSGWSVDLSSDGNRLAVGAINNDSNGVTSGHVRVFDWDGTSWIQVGSDIDGEASGDYFGIRLALSSNGGRLAVGADRNDGINGVNSGHVRVFDWDGSNWIQVGSDIDGEAAYDRSGFDISLSSDGSRLAIGAIYNDGNGVDSGHVRVFDWDGTSWVQVGSDIDGEAAGDYASYSISLSSDGSRLAIGADSNDGVSGTDSGHVRVFDWDGSNWIQVGSDIDGEAAGDYFGWSVALSSSGNRLAVGSPGALYGAGDVGYLKIFDYIGKSAFLTGFSSSNIFTISTNKNTTKDKKVAYYGRVRSVDTSGNKSDWTNIVKSGDTILIDGKYIGSIPASKITSGMITGQWIALNGSSTVLKSSNYISGTTGWAITGSGSAEFAKVGIGKSSPLSELDVVGDITVSGTVDGRNISVDGTKLDGIEDNATADQTPQEILTAIKTVDGPDSGLDADTLDGNHAADFEPVGTTATHAADNDIHVVAGTATGQVATWNNSTGAWEAQVTDHGALTGLADDDHSQYLLADGTRAANTLVVNGDFSVAGGSSSSINFKSESIATATALDNTSMGVVPGVKIYSESLSTATGVDYSSDDGVTGGTSPSTVDYNIDARRSGALAIVTGTMDILATASGYGEVVMEIIINGTRHSQNARITEDVLGGSGRMTISKVWITPLDTGSSIPVNLNFWKTSNSGTVTLQASHTSLEVLVFG